MRDTGNDSKLQNQSLAKSPADRFPLSGSGAKSLSSAEENSASKILSKSLAEELMSLIRTVNKDGVTPETVKVSCACAAEITKLLKLNYEMKKSGL